MVVLKNSLQKIEIFLNLVNNCQIIKMNSLLKLEFFKSLGFPSKEAGMSFIKDNPKLKKQIDEKVDEIDEMKYQVIEDIKEKIFPKYEDKKEVFLIKVKNERSEKLAYKKELQKKALKEEMREEILKELREEEMDEKKNKLKKKYPKSIPTIDEDASEKLKMMEEMFVNVMKKIESGDVDEDEIKAIEKMKDQVEKAVATIIKVSNSLEKY